MNEKDFLEFVKGGKDVEEVEGKFDSDFLMKYGDWIKVDGGEVTLNKEGEEEIGTHKLARSERVLS